MAKYKVGDRVVVREDLVLHKVYYMQDNIVSDSFVEPMDKLCGLVVTISDVSVKYKVKEDPKRLNWTDEMFAGLESDLVNDLPDLLDIKALFG